MLTKTQARVLQVFAGNITEQFSIREIARKLEMHVSLAHRAIKPLIEERILIASKKKLLSIDYRQNHDVLAFIEYMRRNEFSKKNSAISIFAKEIEEKIKEDCFVLILFGSAVISHKPRDIDFLLIVDSKEKIEFHEKFMENIASNYALPLETHVISFESVYEMLAKRDEANLMNEILNKHIIFYGAELFFRLMRRGRK